MYKENNSNHVLIFCFVFTNAFTIFANISYAESEIGKQDSEYTSKNVNYDVNFIKAEEKEGIRI